MRLLRTLPLFRIYCSLYQWCQVAGLTDTRTFMDLNATFGKQKLGMAILLFILFYGINKQTKVCKIWWVIFSSPVKLFIVAAAKSAPELYRNWLLVCYIEPWISPQGGWAGPQIGLKIIECFGSFGMVIFFLALSLECRLDIPIYIPFLQVVFILATTCC